MCVAFLSAGVLPAPVHVYKQTSSRLPRLALHRPLVLPYIYKVKYLLVLQIMLNRTETLALSLSLAK